MSRRISAFILFNLLGGLLLLSGCSQAIDPWSEAKPGQKKILASFPPLYCFAANVAGPDAYVQCLLTTQGPHGYQPDNRDKFRVKGADLFLVNGLELDDFVADLASKVGSKAEVVKVADAIPHEYLLHNNPDSEHEHDPDGKCCEHGEHDPHVWLMPEFAQKMVDRIAEKLAALDPPNAAGYHSRAAAYKLELQQLQTHGEQAFKGKKDRNLIAQHASLRYFADAFKLTMLDSIHPRPGMEADARKMAALVSLCQEQKVRAICIEPQYSKRTAEALVNQLQRHKVAIQLVEVDPMETAKGNPNPDPGFYLQRLRDNIDNLAKALP